MGHEYKSPEQWAFIEEKLGKDIPVVVELGTEEGYWAERLIRNVGAERFYGIDKFLFRDRARKWVARMVPWIGWNVFPIRGDVLEVGLWFPHSIDLLYVDAGKGNEEVTKTLALWVPKVREGGLVIGHDYNLGGPRKGARRYFGEERIKTAAWGPKPQCRSYWVTKRYEDEVQSACMAQGNGTGEGFFGEEQLPSGVVSAYQRPVTGDTCHCVRDLCPKGCLQCWSPIDNPNGDCVCDGRMEGQVGDWGPQGLDEAE